MSQLAVMVTVCICYVALSRALAHKSKYACVTLQLFTILTAEASRPLPVGCILDVLWMSYKS